MKWLILLMLLTMSACESQEPKAPPAEANTTSTASQTADQAAAKTAEKTAWGIEVEGQPKLEGSSIERKENADGGQTVHFFGTPAIARVELTPEGTLDRVIVGYPEKVRCFFEAGAHEVKLDFQLQGNRGTLAGEIPCGMAVDREVPTKITAWFDAELKKRPPMPEARDFKHTDKVKLTKEGLKKVEEE